MPFKIQIEPVLPSSTYSLRVYSRTYHVLCIPPRQSWALQIKVPIIDREPSVCRGLVVQPAPAQIEVPNSQRISCLYGSFLVCSLPTREARVRFSAGTCQYWSSLSIDLNFLQSDYKTQNIIRPSISNRLLHTSYNR
jgi:hypothetical protein